MAAHQESQPSQGRLSTVLYVGCFLVLWLITICLLLAFSSVHANVHYVESSARTEPLVTSRLDGDIVLFISFGLAGDFFGFFLLTLALTLRKRRLKLWELLNYMAGAAVTLATLSCFRLRGYRSYDVVFLHHEVNWYSLVACYFLLAPISLLAFQGARR